MAPNNNDTTPPTSQPEAASKSSDASSQPRFPTKDMQVFGNGDHALKWSDKNNGKTADFLWTEAPEPHMERKKDIISQYTQELKDAKVRGPTWKTKYVVLFVVSLQLSFAYLLRDKAWTTWEFWVCSYVIGASLTQNCFLAIHEITHNLAFKSIKLSKCLAIFANLPIGIPYSSKFPGYHLEHHRYQGTDGIDTDIPHPAEAWLFDNLGFPGRLFFAIFQILFYAVRPMAVRDQQVDIWFVINFIFQFSFDGLVVYKFGMGPIWYLLMSAFFSGSLHPLASHFIAEHYVFLEDVETYSYYGWLNLLTFNVGYHNEHHDFPNVAWDKLPVLREVASDHYDNLPYHRSWPLVIWKFLTMDTMSSYSRVKRQDKKSLAKNTTCPGTKKKK
mgnify:FL=1|tara:strand:- start:140 stop:1300 length:1161 start_codon:yes stop_codon:yes gene_type:complete